MTNTAVFRKLRIGAIALAAVLALSAVSFVEARGVGGAGHGGRFGGAYGGHGGSGYGHFGYGHFGYDRFGYGGFGFYGAFGLLGYGLLFETLPLYYSTYWWGGVPYYYANDNFYQWNPSMGQYETVRPPEGLASQVATTQLPQNLSLFVYPKNEQTPAQETTDRRECQNWASGQTGFESPTADGTASKGISLVKRQAYMRAQSACLEGRGYSVQ
jgi:hypothetical protein